MKKIIFSLFLFTLINSTYAKTSSLSVSPSSVKIVSKPNQKIKINYTFRNNGEAMKIKLNVLSLKNIDFLNNKLIFNRGPSQNIKFFLSECKDIKIDEEFLLPHNEELKCTLNADISRNIPYSDNIFLVTLSSVPPLIEEGSYNINISNMIGSNLIISISDRQKIKDSLAISIFLDKRELDSNHLSFYTSEVARRLRIISENTSQNALEIKGQVLIEMPWKKNTRTTIDIPKQLVFSNSKKEVKFMHDVKLNSNLIEAYNIKLQIDTGYNGNLIEINKSFTIISYKLIFSLFVVIVIFVYIVFRLSRVHKT